MKRVIHIDNYIGFEYRIDSDLESYESSVKGIHRYKKDTRYGKRRSKRSTQRRSRPSSTSESNISVQGLHSRSTSRSCTSSGSAAESRTSIKITESLKSFVNKRNFIPNHLECLNASHLQNVLRYLS